MDERKLAALPKLMPSEHARVGVQMTTALVLTTSGMSTLCVKISRLRSASMPSPLVAKERKGTTPSVLLTYLRHSPLAMSALSLYRM